jgi:hypothetical protein
MNNNLITLFFIVFTAASTTGCDPLRQRKCEWYLIPEAQHQYLAEPGSVSVCAKNYKLNRQKCFIQTSISKAEELYGQAFRYVDLKVDKNSFPRKLLSVQTCTPAETTDLP